MENNNNKRQNQYQQNFNINKNQNNNKITYQINQNKNPNNNKPVQQNNKSKSKLTNSQIEAKREALRKQQRITTIKYRIVLGVIIVILILIILLIVKLFNSVFGNNLQNVWSLEVNNQVCYLELEKDNIASISNNSLTFYGTYEQKNNNIININIKDNDKNEIICGDYRYTLKGSSLTNKKLILVKVSNDNKVHNELTLYESIKPRSVEKFDKFIPDDRFTGNWIVKDLNYTYNFSDDGYLTLTMDNISIETAYFINNNIVEIKYIANGDTITYSFVYSFNDDILFINNQNLYNYK